MATIRVSANELKARAEQLNEMNQSLKAKVDEFESAVQALAGQWEGEAKEAFLAAAKQDLEQMLNFIQVILEFYQKLLYMAQNYEATERKNLEIATTRSYG